VKSPVSRKGKLLHGLIGSVVLLLGWQLVSMAVSSAIVASPGATMAELGRLVAEGELWKQLLVTLRRLLVSLVLGAALGLSLGLLAGILPRVRAVLEPVRWVWMTLPAVVIAVLAMLWFGLGDRAVIFLVTAIVTPVIYVNTVEGVRVLDARLVEMGRVYGVPRGLMLTHVYLPGIGSPVIAALTLAAGTGVRGVVLGEVLGAQDGVGHSFARAMSYLDTPQVFAWVLVALALMALLEFAVLRPVRAWVLRWKRH